MIERATKSIQTNDAFKKRHHLSDSIDNLQSQFFSDATNVHLLQRKTSCACGGCPACQAKSNDLKVSQPHDPAEIEADQIADKVMRVTADASVKVSNHHSREPEKLQAKCDACGEEKPEESILRKESYASAADPPPDDGSSVNKILNSGGRPLAPETRGFFEPRFSIDLGHVRVHTDNSAGQSARLINARTTN